MEKISVRQILARWRNSITEIPTVPNTEVKVSKMRWVVLFLYFFHAVFGGGGTFNYVMIPDVLSEYYGISYFFISWTAIIFTTVFIPCFLPIVRFVEGKSLRYITLWASGLFLASALLKEMVTK